MLALNSAVAYQLRQFKQDVEALRAEGKSKEAAIFEVLKAYIKESKPIRFDGNGYGDEWKEEAARRGLDCENSVPLQYDAYLKPEVIRMFKETGVLSEKELEARNEVKWEIYIKRYRSKLVSLATYRSTISSRLPSATSHCYWTTSPN